MYTAIRMNTKGWIKQVMGGESLPKLVEECKAITYRELGRTSDFKLSEGELNNSDNEVYYLDAKVANKEYPGCTDVPVSWRIFKI